MTSSAKSINLPNILSLSRIVLTGFFLFFLFGVTLSHKFIALGIFITACFTDYLDGRIARRNQEITPLGQLLDPIADKILTFGAYLSFIKMGLLPAWMVFIMLAREVLITGFRLLGARRGVEMPAAQGGKNKTALQIASILAFLIYLIVRLTSFWKPEWDVTFLGWLHIAMLFVVAYTLFTGIVYIFKNWHRGAEGRKRKKTGGLGLHRYSRQKFR